MEGLPEGVDSKFRYVLLVSKRAEQIIQGAHPKMKSKHAKATRVAMEELDASQLEYSTPELPVGAADKDGKRRKE